MREQHPKLLAENQQYAGTGGVSEENAHAGFLPAFKDSESGQIAVSRFKDGRIAPCHLMDGLPENWILSRDPHGRVEEIKPSVISGFVRLGQFFTRQEAASQV